MFKGRKGLTNNDCVAACIRSLINDDNVPNFVDGVRKSPEIWGLLRDYLKTKRKTLALFTVQDPWEFMEEVNPGIYYILLCQVTGGDDHAVVCKNGQVVFDPSPIERHIIGPHSSGMWIVAVIGEIT